MGTAELAEQFVEALLESNEGALSEICSEEVEFVVPGMSATGVQPMLDYNQVFLTAFPDAGHELVNRLDIGDTTVFEILYRGTNTGPMVTPQGEMPATGAKISIPGAMIVTTSGGKVVSFHGYFDQLGMLTQLGVMGQPA